MNTDRLNKWLTLAANIGVIAGIIFLALELRQNSGLMKAQSRTAMSQDVVSLLTLNVGNADYIDAMSRGISGDELTEVERVQFRRTYRAWIWYWNNLAYQHRVGLYDDAEFDLQIKTIRADMETFPGLKKHWCDYSSRDASAELTQAIESGSDGNFCRD